MTRIEEIFRRLQVLSDPQRAEGQKRFFKTDPGQYGYGDQFLGLSLPQIRLLVKEFWRSTDFADLEKLYASIWHEARALAVLMLVKKFEMAQDKITQKEIFDFYTAHLPRANNWDLIDLSAYKIIGAYLYNRKDRGLFYRLARSKNLWQQRAAIVATMYLVKRREFQITLDLAEQFLSHPHDLIHKATGWLLREVGKKDEAVLCAFLDTHAVKMPRTMLRYSLEKLSPDKRKYYLEK